MSDSNPSQPEHCSSNDSAWSRQTIFNAMVERRFEQREGDMAVYERYLVEYARGYHNLLQRGIAQETAHTAAHEESNTRIERLETLIRGLVASFPLDHHEMQRRLDASQAQIEEQQRQMTEAQEMLRAQRRVLRSQRRVLGRWTAYTQYAMEARLPAEAAARYVERMATHPGGQDQTRNAQQFANAYPLPRAPATTPVDGQVRLGEPLWTPRQYLVPVEDLEQRSVSQERLREIRIVERLNSMFFAEEMSQPGMEHVRDPIQLARSRHGERYAAEMEWRGQNPEARVGSHNTRPSMRQAPDAGTPYPDREQFEQHARAVGDEQQVAAAMEWYDQNLAPPANSGDDAATTSPPDPDMEAIEQRARARHAEHLRYVAEMETRGQRPEFRVWNRNRPRRVRHPVPDPGTPYPDPEQFERLRIRSREQGPEEPLPSGPAELEKEEEEANTSWENVSQEQESGEQDASSASTSEQSTPEDASQRE